MKSLKQNLEEFKNLREDIIHNIKDDLESLDNISCKELHQIKAFLAIRHESGFTTKESILKELDLI